MDHEYEVTLEDLVAFNMHYFRHNSAIRRQLLSGRILVALLTTLLALLFIFVLNTAANRNQPLDWFAAAVSVVGGGVIFLIYPLLSQCGLQRRAIRLLADPANRSMLGKKRLVLGPDAIEFQSELSTSSTKWAGLERIATTDSLILLYLTAMSAIVVPKRSFADASQAQAFEQQVQGHYHAATGQPLRRV